MPKHHPEHPHDELPSIDAAALAGVTGGAGADMSSMMLPMMMMMKRRNEAAMAAPPPAPAEPPRPKILLNGVEQPASALTGNGDASTFTTTV